MVRLERRKVARTETRLNLHVGAAVANGRVSKLVKQLSGRERVPAPGVNLKHPPDITVRDKK
jgi:hypothetical protein